MHTIIYPTLKPLKDVPCNAVFKMCIPETLLTSGAPFIDATLLHVTIVAGPCGDTIYHNYISYDETLLIDSTTPINAYDIQGYIYDPCLLAYIDYMISQVSGS